MANKKELIIHESGTHWTIHLPVEEHDLVVMVDKKDFTIILPFWEYMSVNSILKIIVNLIKDDDLRSSPVIQEFLKFLKRPENKDEEFTQLKSALLKIL